MGQVVTFDNSPVLSRSILFFIAQFVPNVLNIWRQIVGPSLMWQKTQNRVDVLDSNTIFIVATGAARTARLAKLGQTNFVWCKLNNLRLVL